MNQVAKPKVASLSVPVITIDGPGGTGKGTICYQLAAYLNWHILDSGCIYRILAYATRTAGIKFTNVTAISTLAASLNIEFPSNAPQAKVLLLNGKNVFEEIRSEQCGQDASVISAIPEIRQALLDRQRDFAKPPGLVTDGRDMGTVVFPEAILKIYLYASAEERAQRRFFQLKEKGIDVSLAEVVKELSERDARDTARAHSPLKPAKDAVLIDTTGLTIVQVFKNVLKLVEERKIFRVD